MFSQLLLGVFPEDWNGHVYVWIISVGKRGKACLASCLPCNSAEKWCVSRGEFSTLKIVPSPREELDSPLCFSLIVVESTFPAFQCHAVIAVLLLLAAVLLSSLPG